MIITTVPSQINGLVTISFFTTDRAHFLCAWLPRIDTPKLGNARTTSESQALDVHPRNCKFFMTYIHT